LKRLAVALDLARRRRSRIAKEEAIGGALATIAADGDDVTLATAARVAAGRLLPVGDGRALGVGWSLLLDVARAATGEDDEILLACARKTGELAEALGLLLRRVPGAEERAGLGLGDVARLADALAAEPGRTGKRALLDAAFARATPLEAKYLGKALGGGMRIGAQEGAVEGAIARGFGAAITEVRRAAALVTDPGDLAVLARHGALGEARLVVGRPVAFMLATPLETIATPVDPAAHVVEDKIDGVRSQAHRAADGSVTLFARGLDRVTEAFPEVVEALRAAPAAAVLDGEIVAVAPSGRPRPFQALQPRLKKSRPSPADLAETQVTLVAFDLLADGDGPLIERPWSERRARLEALARALPPGGAIVVNPVVVLPPHEPFEQALDAAFQQARARGHEGLVLKRTDAPYDAGRRGQAWIKVKRAHATLDVVVVAAEEGHGRRAGVLSDYTFAVWSEPEGEAAPELLPVGKAYSGLGDDEIDAMTRRLESLTIEQRGGVRLVRTEIVLEVAFDGVQRSSRHPSGFALRFPRIVRVRDDKAPQDADRLASVRALFEAQVATGHREPGARATRARKKPRPEAAKRQLSLFGDDE
jgi:DNA ligase-1